MADTDVVVYTWDKKHVLLDRPRSFLYLFELDPPMEAWIAKQYCRIDEEAQIVEIPQWKVNEVYGIT